MDETADYQFDLVVIGGGSGGLALSKRAAQLGARVAVLDFVKPSPQGTTWGLGGTCVNVGCIPKKLMHQAGLIGHCVEDAEAFGWKDVTRPDLVDWGTLVQNIDNHIRSLNFGYRVALMDNDVKYFNAFGTIVDAHTIRCVNKNNVESIITTDKICFAPGGRPTYPKIPGAELGISSDDLFWRKEAPGRTLVVGASYVALECAGFLTSLGFDTTVMVRSIFLRGFDQEMANKIGDFMKEHGTKFIQPAVPTKVEKLESGKLLVTFNHDGTESSDEFDTVMWAIGRRACTQDIGLEALGVKLNERNGKVIVDDHDCSSVPNFYAIGDVSDGKLELTPSAIQAGNLLAERLYGGSSKLMDYVNVCTTVFTPIEYGCCGLSEEAAIDQFGQENLEIFHQNFTPLEWTVPHRGDNVCFAKIICNKNDNNRLLGFHYMGPNAGEVTQGFGLALQFKATKDDLDKLVGIHPTTAEILTTMTITKSSGESALGKGC